MPSQTNVETPNYTAVAALSLIHLFGLNSMYGLVYRNEYLKALLRLRDHGPYVLPGSNNPILTRFTGIGVLEKLLTLAGVMFANVTDGSAPELSLYGFQFAGQLVSILTVMVIEGLRLGNKRNAMSLSVLWGCAMQALGYGFTMPIYAIVHLLTSSTATGLRRRIAEMIMVQDLNAVETLSYSLIVGYIAPTVLMCLPIPSNFLHQWLGGFWQGFPVWVAILQFVFAPLMKEDKIKPSNSNIVNSGSGHGHPSPPNKNEGEVKKNASSRGIRINETNLLHRAYIFAFALSTATQFSSYAILGTRKVFPTWFSPLCQEKLTFRKVFLPPHFGSHAPMGSMASGIHNFFQYDQYVGSTAAIVWATVLNVKVRKAAMTIKDWVLLGGEIFCVSLIAGPAGALVSLMWNRDDMIMSDDELYEE